MSLYLGCGVATRAQGNERNSHVQVYTLLADTLTEAEGWALAHLRTLYPMEHGFTYALRLYPTERANIDNWYAAYHKDEASG
jgi:hypothetical protein